MNATLGMQLETMGWSLANQQQEEEEGVPGHTKEATQIRAGGDFRELIMRARLQGILKFRGKERTWGMQNMVAFWRHACVMIPYDSPL